MGRFEVCCGNHQQVETLLRFRPLTASGILGQGLGTEGGLARLQYAFDVIRDKAPYAMLDCKNRASDHVL